MIFINLELFSSEHRKNIIEIFGELFNLEIQNHPLAEALAPEADEIVESIFAKFDQNNMSSHYATILKMMSSRYELVKSFLTLNVIKTL